eukprot:TRINITY_DN18444_c0_g1_i1.p2 TRINITY_DN18444_c0_g1~~TRINITY_DN18444_c0_g1_i1.p2  ORF type:complete len:218 (+),score=42.62 TRINITY_DN18444_c0_g1_i1:196-849(+)
MWANTVGGLTGLRLPQLSLLIMYWLIVNLGIGLNVSLWVYLGRKGELTSWMVDLHLALTIVGLVLYVFVGSGYIFWAYQYQYFMFMSEQRLRIMFAVGLCFIVRDLPCWFMELLIWWDHGFFHPLQSVSFAMTSLTFLIGLVALWLEYAWRMSKVMDRRFGTESHIFTGPSHPKAEPRQGITWPYNPFAKGNAQQQGQLRAGGIGHLDEPFIGAPVA